MAPSRPRPHPEQDQAMKLLHLDSSALGTQSASRELSAAIVARHLAANPGLEIAYRDLDADPLPHLDGAARRIGPALHGTAKDAPAADASA